VALIPPADTPLIRLRSVLWVADELFVEFVFVVNVRLSTCRLISYADFFCRSFCSGCA
jgi:hypothetical protein